MKAAILSLKVLFYGYLVYLLIFLAISYEPAQPGYHPPFALFVLDMINLFIHEAGHLFLKVFGQWIYILGGSLVQVMLPALLLVVTWRQNRPWIGLPAFWTGESMINVSVYVKDAPTRQLKLIASGLIHDWNWLLSGDPDMAEFLGATLWALGLLFCTAGIAAGIYFAIRRYREDIPLVAD